MIMFLWETFQHLSGLWHHFNVPIIPIFWLWILFPKLNKKWFSMDSPAIGEIP